MDFTNPRQPEAAVDCTFPDRWSPRAFRTDGLSNGQVSALFEAARWAPSCFNEQPWHFTYARTEKGRALLASALLENNRAWASQAPLILFLATRRTFSRGQKTNRHAAFDAGAAWMSLALQARRLGLYAHAMAGFDRDRAYEVTGLDRDEFDVLAAVVVGLRDDPASLPEEVRAMERPNTRKALAHVAEEVVE